MSMSKKLNFNQLATALAALGTVSFVAGDLAASEASHQVGAVEVEHARQLGEGDKGGDQGDKGDKDKKKKDDTKKGKKKKGKKDGSCGAKGGCGAGSCG